MKRCALKHVSGSSYRNSMLRQQQVCDPHSKDIDAYLNLRFNMLYKLTEDVLSEPFRASHSEWAVWDELFRASHFERAGHSERAVSSEPFRVGHPERPIRSVPFGVCRAERAARSGTFGARHLEMVSSLHSPSYSNAADEATQSPTTPQIENQFDSTAATHVTASQEIVVTLSDGTQTVLTIPSSSATGSSAEGLSTVGALSRGTTTASEADRRDGAIDHWFSSSISPVSSLHQLLVQVSWPVRLPCHGDYILNVSKSTLLVQESYASLQWTIIGDSTSVYYLTPSTTKPMKVLLYVIVKPTGL